METLHVPAQLIDPLSCNDGWSYIPVSPIFDKTNTSRDSHSNRKPFICPGSQTQNCRVCAHNVSWKVNVWTLSELSHLARARRVWCVVGEVKHTLTRLLSPSKDSPDTPSLVRAHVSSSLLWLCPLQVGNKQGGKRNNSAKWRDKNNLTHTNEHTCHPRTASPWPCHHILLLSSQSVAKKK